MRVGELYACRVGEEEKNLSWDYDKARWSFWVLGYVEQLKNKSDRYVVRAVVVLQCTDWQTTSLTTRTCQVYMRAPHQKEDQTMHLDHEHDDDSSNHSRRWTFYFKMSKWLGNIIISVYLCHFLLCKFFLLIVSLGKSYFVHFHNNFLL